MARPSLGFAIASLLLTSPCVDRHPSPVQSHGGPDRGCQGAASRRASALGPRHWGLVRSNPQSLLSIPHFWAHKGRTRLLIPDFLDQPYAIAVSHSTGTIT